MHNTQRTSKYRIGFTLRHAKNTPQLDWLCQRASIRSHSFVTHWFIARRLRAGVSQSISSQIMMNKFRAS
jgi:hypothetical protein